MVQAKLGEFGWNITDFDAGVSHAGKRAFWLMDIDTMQGRGSSHDLFSLSIGGRTCWDKTYASGIAGGDHTFVCDNLMLVGEFKLNRKHTTYNLRDLPGLVHDVISRLSSRFHILIERNQRYMERIISIPQAENLIFEAFDRGAVSKSKVTDVRNQFISPKHKEFELGMINGAISGSSSRLSPRSTRVWSMETSSNEVRSSRVFSTESQGSMPSTVRMNLKSVLSS